MGIIDCHTHLIHPGETIEHLKNTSWPTFEARIAVLREAGISRALAGRGARVEDVTYEELLERNKRIYESCKASDGFYFPSAEIQPALGEKACDLLKFCHDELGMRFIGEMFDRWLGYKWGTPEYYRFLECAVELRMIPLIHCQNDVASEIGERYPEGKFLIAHSRDNNRHNRVDALKDYPNLYLDISGSEIARADEINERVAMLGIDHIVFGSDLGAVDPVIAVMCVKRSNLSEDEKKQVFAGNFHKLWAWTEG